MKLIFLVFNKTSLHIAVEKGNIEIVELLLKHPRIDINSQSISNLVYYKYHSNH